MNYEMTKFERGQVWKVKFKYGSPAVGHEQSKDRPYLVLSVGKFNKSSGLVTMVPISSRREIATPAQVAFYNHEDCKNVIMCEHIRTFDYKSDAYIFEFMGNLSEEVLEKVDVAISIHLGMHYSPITLNKLYASMESIVKSVTHMNKEARFTDEDVSRFAEKLQTLAARVEREPVPREEPRETSPAYFYTMEEDELDTKESDIETPVSEVNTSTATKPEKRIYRKWDLEICKEFLSDCETLPTREVMKKWNISVRSQYYNKKKYAKNILEKNTRNS